MLHLRHHPTKVHSATREILRRRMTKPQRHRLLHSFPLAAAMPPINTADAIQGMEAFRFSPATQRQLLVGVLPHPFCNPAVQGCGFCTFPHEQFNAAKAAAVADRLVKELQMRVAADSSLVGRRVHGLYFGGGTANLTPAESFRKVCSALRQTLNLSDAEVTLEGVPSYFIRRQPLLLDILDQELSVRQRRISMGIQTFDENRLKQMGRLGYGTGSVFADVVRAAHRRQMTASGDLLFNLPGQSLAEMRSDLSQAIDIGLDHLGLYHLVAFRGLKTVWSQNEELLAQLPKQAEAVDNWLALREQVLESGFVQTSLTNFERREFVNQPTRFLYEERSFQPSRFEMLGLGPAAISCGADQSFQSAWKTINPESSHDYLHAVDSTAHVVSKAFRYDRNDLKAFYLTRRLSALSIDEDEYHDLFQSSPQLDITEVLDACFDEGLFEQQGSKIVPTPKGMFFSDSISALLAAPRLSAHRRNGTSPSSFEGDSGLATNDNAYGHM